MGANVPTVENKYHFKLKHLFALLAILVTFQILVSLVHRLSLKNLMLKTQGWYQQDFAERLANLTTTSLEMLMETTLYDQTGEHADTTKIVKAFNIILTQQLLQHHVEEVCILICRDDSIYAIDNGHILFSYIMHPERRLEAGAQRHMQAVKMYRENRSEIIRTEQILSIVEQEQIFHVLVPLVPKGEFFGVVYVKSKPDFGFMTRGIISSYDESSLIFTALILFGLLAMFYISTYTVRERNEAQRLLYEEKTKQLTEHINLQKEALFAKRIYHTHHKAEKVMGFIKEDLHDLNEKNMEEIKYRVTKYANFISRVIYDMKLYEPPLQTIRNPIFNTDLNELIHFIVENIFLRLSASRDIFNFDFDFDERLPYVHVNEFVVWEVIEPLIQNSIEHSGKERISIVIQTRFDEESGEIKVRIRDNGVGVKEELMLTNEDGIKMLFLENVSTKTNAQQKGYGCYIAYEIATQRCGWQIDVRNIETGGCEFTITIPNL
ncbi:histidine kinase [candidate division KSB1 bacterium]|nr:histidine kinase [candidate division KSB1 bacterium]